MKGRNAMVKQQELHGVHVLSVCLGLGRNLSNALKFNHGWTQLGSYCYFFFEEQYCGSSDGFISTWSFRSRCFDSSLRPLMVDITFVFAVGSDPFLTGQLAYMFC